MFDWLWRSKQVSNLLQVNVIIISIWLIWAGIVTLQWERNQDVRGYICLFSESAVKKRLVDDDINHLSVYVNVAVMVN